LDNERVDQAVIEDRVAEFGELFFIKLFPLAIFGDEDFGNRKGVHRVLKN
jgi:hypothetical protein